MLLSRKGQTQGLDERLGGSVICRASDYADFNAGFSFSGM